MKRILLSIIITTCLASCKHATLEDSAENMANEYTERYCPSPVNGMQRTDSVTFDRDTHTFNYYYTLTDKADDPVVVGGVKKSISNALLKELKENTSLKAFKDAHYAFRYVFNSQRNKATLLELTFKANDYK